MSAVALGSVAEEDSIGLAMQYGLSGFGRRHDGHAATGLDEVPQDVLLDAEVERDHVEPRAGTAGLHGEGAFEASLPVVGVVGRDRLDEVLSDDVFRLDSHADQLDFVVGLGRDHAVERALDPQAPRERACVDAFDADHAVVGEVVVERLTGSEVGVSARQLLDGEALDPGLFAFDVFVGDAVVADLRAGHDHDLPAIGWIGEDLLVAHHGGVEDDLAEARTPSAKGRADKDGSILESELADRFA